MLTETGDVRVTKMAIEPVWYLPGIAERFGIGEPELRRALFEESGGMYTELVTRPDVKVFLPPVGGITVYGFGDVAAPARSGAPVTCRVHDECNGSDVFGSDICTCRPYLMHGIEECVAAAQGGGTGFVVYNRKEGRALGEVTKFLVYNAREAPAGRRPRGNLLRADGVCGRRPGHAFPGAHARRAALARDPAHRALRLHERHEVRRDRGAGNRDSNAKSPSRPSSSRTTRRWRFTAKRAAGYYSEDGAPSDRRAARAARAAR